MNSADLHHHPARQSLLSKSIARCRTSVLSWPVWLRVAAILPVCALLWLGVLWAMTENIA